MWELVGGKGDGVKLGEPESVVRIPGGGGWLVLGLASLVAPASSRQVKRRGCHEWLGLWYGAHSLTHLECLRLPLGPSKRGR